MRIVLVHNSYQQYGGETVVFEMEQRMLEAAGHDVITYCRSNSEVASYGLMRKLALPPKVIWGRASCQSFRALIQECRPDVVHVHNTFFMISPAIYSVCRAQNVPVVQTLHNYRLLCPAATFFRKGAVCEECVDHGLFRSIAHGCYRNSRVATATVASMLAFHRRRRTWTTEIDCYVVLSEFARTKFIAAGLPSERIFVKPNFVDPDPGENKGKGEYVLFAGRLAPEKRIDELLQASRRVPKTEVRILGEGPEDVRLHRLARDLGLTNVRFMGGVDRNAVIAAMRRACLVVLPSGWYEGLPVSIVEAFACGVPVLVSRLGSLSEIVREDVTGLLFRAGDAEDLAMKLKWACDHPDELQNMGKAARLQYESRYTMTANYSALTEIYRQAIANRHMA